MNKKLGIIIMLVVGIYILIFLIIYGIYNIHLVLLDLGFEVKMLSKHFINLIEILKKIK